MTAIAAAAVLAGCGGGDGSGAPGPLPGPTPTSSATNPPVDVAALPADRLVASVLDACHRPLVGQMARLSAVLRAPGQPEWRLFAELPGRLRAQSPAARLLLRDGAPLRLDGGPASDDEAALLRRLALALDVAALGPLHRARGCTRTGPTTFALDTGDGARWQVELAADALEPRAFVAGDTRIQIVAAQRTATTWIVRRVAVPGLGACEVAFEDSGIAWGDDFFAPIAPQPTEPTASTTTQRPQQPTRMRAPGAEPESEVPTIVDGRELRQVLLPDPGDWPTRAERYRAVHDELVRQQQQIAGFGALLHDDDGAWLAVPFRQRPGKPALTAPADWRITDHAAGRWLVVYPADGDCAVRIAAGERLLRAKLDADGLTALGPITAQPYLHLEKGPPDQAALQAVKVRVAVPIR